MNKRPLGKTGIEVSEIAMGGLFVASRFSEQADAIQAVRRGLELGVNYVDTAPGYLNSEEIMGLALSGTTAPHYLSTKLGGKPQPFEPQNKDCLRRSVEESLRLLKRDHIDILMIHEPDRPGQYDWWSDPERYYGPVLEVLRDLKDEGVITYTGIGGTTAYEMVPIIETGLFDVLLTAFNYSLLWREAEIAVLPAAIRQGMGIIIGSPLQQGALARQYEEIEKGAVWLSPPRRHQFQELYRFVDELNMNLPELALRFVLSHPHIATVLSGVRSVREIEANIQTAEKGPLNQAILDRLDEIAAMVPYRPFEEPFNLPFGRPYYGPGQA